MVIELYYVDRCLTYAMEMLPIHARAVTGMCKQMHGGTGRDGVPQKEPCSKCAERAEVKGQV